jgi:hypothetical protein
MRHLTAYNLFEMNANPYMWKWTTIPATTNRVATFNSDDDRYFVEFMSSGYDNTYKVTFESDKYGVNATGFGNADNAMRVLATVLDIVIAFLDENAEYEVEYEVEFIGVKDDDDNGPSKRDRIYKMMIKDLPDTYKWELMGDKKTIHISRQLVYESENKKSVVTFDFDGVLHTGIYPGTIHPLPSPELWTPNDEMIDKMREEAKTHTIYIVTARDSMPNGGPNPWVKQFVKENNLPVDGIICTNDRPKRPFLEKLGSIRHYDDNPSMKAEMTGSDIEFVFVDTNK